MARTPSLIRVTSVGSFLNSSWKEYWYRGLEKELAKIRAAECVKFAAEPRSAEQWEQMLARYSPLREADRISDESTKFGKGIHRVVENHLLGVPMPTGMQPETPTVRELAQGNLLVKWCKEAYVKPLIIDNKPGIEFELKDEELGLIGHPDLLNTFGEEKDAWVTDWKSSKEVRIEYVIQLALYSELAYRQHGLAIDNGAIIRAPSDPTVVPQFQDYSYHGLRGKYLELALEALDVFKFFNNKGRWRG